MRDIVATIQPDQDDIVRAPLTESICVQGAPGTGKTAVGLHRAAYLLYTHGGQLARVRRPGRRAQPGVPALHRAGAADPRRGRRRPDDGRRPDRPGAGARRRPARRSPSSRATRGWPRCCAARCGARSPSPTDSIQVPLAGRKYRVPVERLKRYVDDVRRRGRADDDQQLLHYAAGRERLAMLVAEDARRQKEEAGGSPTDAETRRAARSAEVRAFCDEVWPARDAAGAGARPAGPTRRGWPGPPAASSTDDEQALLRWPAPPRSVRTAPWTDGRRRAGRRGRRAAGAHARLRARRASTRRRTSRPMQCRAVARRLAAGSLTVLGDLAQATSPWSPSDWQADAGRPRPPGHRRPPADPRLPGARRGARLRQPAAAADRARPAGGHRGPLRARLAAASGR